MVWGRTQVAMEWDIFVAWIILEMIITSLVLSSMSILSKLTRGRSSLKTTDENEIMCGF